MGMQARSRDAEAEQLERDAYLLLRHLHTATGADPNREVLGARLANALGLDRGYTLRVIRLLEREGFIRYNPAGPCVSLTQMGAAYVDHLARRRRSVRRRWP